MSDVGVGIEPHHKKAGLVVGFALHALSLLSVAGEERSGRLRHGS